MRPDPGRNAAARASSWLASRRRRRLALVFALFPGAALAIAGAQILVSPPILLAGLVWLAVGLGVARMVARRLPPLAPPPSHDPLVPKEPVS
ncbi:hypothetical protein [Caulobacter sp.]|uniref:hypothetical protein n=1 Tax=Caulobacter sp. TaxID=78 RepID=UPI001B1BE9F6|nr:hypothetical protein [Caulobacter sp.]MBO9547137.1 hypothetical protein [Caulobacter sp.]